MIGPLMFIIATIAGLSISSRRVSLKMRIIYPAHVDEQKVIEWLKDNIIYSTLTSSNRSAYDNKGVVYGVYSWFSGCPNTIYMRRKKDKKLFVNWIYNLSR